ncbi:MAG: hypothetical protein A2Y55_11970 [Actinobacteria bacterium RBG_16_68_12]|nr:MAG: hypothetical protein A2Y55_11970 [Actinobacteria bacterium RBG_16_68_12]
MSRRSEALNREVVAPTLRLPLPLLPETKSVASVHRVSALAQPPGEIGLRLLGSLTIRKRVESLVEPGSETDAVPANLPGCQRRSKAVQESPAGDVQYSGGVDTRGSRKAGPEARGRSRRRES